MANYVTTPGATISFVATTGERRGRDGRRECRTARAMVVAFAAVVTIGALAGCGGGSSTTSTGNSTSTGEKSTSEKSTGNSSKAPYTDAEACTWVKENLPTIPDTEIGAQAQLTIGLSGFFEDHGGLQNADGYALDDALARGCPDVRAAALKKAGIKSFGNL